MKSVQMHLIIGTTLVINNFFSSTIQNKCLFAVCQNSHRSQKMIDEKKLSTASGLVCLQPKGGFPVIAEITCMLAANTRRQFFFVITTTASTCFLVENFY